MSFWTAIVTIVLIGTVGGLLRDVIKRKKDQPKRNDLLDAKVAEHAEQLERLQASLDALQDKVAEQEIFVDEAIAQFRPRLDRLRSAATQADRPRETEPNDDV